MAVTVALALAACGGGGSSQQKIQPQTPGSPLHVDPPSDPGVLAAGPAGLQLAPGSTGTAVATLFDSTGAPTTVGSVTWTTGDAGVVTVDPSGAFTAIAPGTALLTVTDAAERMATMLVIVSSAPPAGPVAVQFRRPVITVTLGTPGRVHFQVTDARGVPMATPAGLSLVATPAGIVDPSPVGTLTPLAAGTAVVRASLDGGTTFLAGELLVLVGTPLATQACSKPLDYSVVSACRLIAGPARFTTPHLAAGPIRILVGRQPSYPICLPGGALGTLVKWQEESPDEVRFKAEGVVTVNGAGRLESEAPGATYLSLYKEGVYCDGYRVRVDPDLNSAWNVSCGNGDTGQTCVTDWDVSVTTYSPSMAGATGVETPFRPGTTSSASNATDGFSCTGSDTVFGPEVEFPGPMSGSQGDNLYSAPCTAQVPCVGPVPPVCALSRNMATCEGNNGLPQACYNPLVLGPDHLKIGTCDLTRAATSDCGGGGWQFSDSISGAVCCGNVDPNYCVLDGTMSVTNSGGTLSGTWKGTLTSVILSGGQAVAGTTPQSGTVSGTMSSTTMTLTLTGPMGPTTLSGAVTYQTGTEVTLQGNGGCSHLMTLILP
jgi:hypothetical protein